MRASLYLAVVLVLALAFIIYHFAFSGVKGHFTLTGGQIAQYRQEAGSNGAFFGVEGASAYNSTVLSDMHYIGVNTVRFDVSFDNQTRANAKMLAAKGFGLLGILDYRTLGVGSANYTCVSMCNWTLGDWNSSVSNAVETYPEVHSWELWNEPLVPMFQSGLVNGSAHNYYLMARSAHRIIKAHNNSDSVVCLGGAGLDPESYNWTRQLWQYNISNYCDAISIHEYTAFTYLFNQTPAGSYYNLSTYAGMGLDLFHNLTGKNVWITEMGIPSNNGSMPYLGNNPDKQAAFLAQGFATMLTRPYVKGIFWFNLQGQAVGLDFGLLNDTAGMKPAAHIFRDFANATAS